MKIYIFDTRAQNAQISLERKISAADDEEDDDDQEEEETQNPNRKSSSSNTRGILNLRKANK